MKPTARRRRGLTLTGVLAVVLAFAFSSSHAQQSTESDDIRAGRALALKVCTACHVVLPDQGSEPILQPPARPFRSIARKPGTTAESLRSFLAGPHRTFGNARNMPNPELTDAQIAQVSAFLLSLRDQP
jgi:mono/diheme cytochrome c family protein